MLDLSAGSWLLRPVQAHSLRHLIAWPIAAAALLTAPGAVADDNDPATIEQRLKALETTPERQTVLREPAANARKAIQRVLDARAAGDAAHANEGRHSARPTEDDSELHGALPSFCGTAVEDFTGPHDVADVAGPSNPQLRITCRSA